MYCCGTLRPPIDDGVGSEAQVVPGADPLLVLGHGDVEVPRAHRAALGAQDVLAAVVGEAEQSRGYRKDIFCLKIFVIPSS